VTKLEVLSPELAQSRFVARLLRRAGFIVTGVLMPGDCARIIRYPYFSVRQLSGAPSDRQLVPTGSASTRLLIDTFGNVQLGRISMGRGELQFMDKQWALEFAESNGLRVPRTWYTIKDASFPAFCKPRLEGATGPRQVFYTLEEVRGFESQPIAQQIVRSSSTVGVAFIAHQGTVLTSFAHRETLSYPAEGGSAVTLEHSNDLEAVRYTMKLVKASNFSGWGLAEFKRDEIDGSLYFMELNPKMWASMYFAFENEPKFAELLFGLRQSARRITRSTNWYLACRRGPKFLLKEARVLLRATPHLDLPAFANSAIRTALKSSSL